MSALIVDFLRQLIRASKSTDRPVKSVSNIHEYSDKIDFLFEFLDGQSFGYSRNQQTGASSMSSQIRLADFVDLGSKLNRAFHAFQ